MVGDFLLSLRRRPGVPATRGFRVAGWRSARSCSRQALGGLLGTQRSGARTKNSVPNQRSFFLAGLPAPSSHNGTSALEDADFLVGCEQVFARIFWRLLRVQKETVVATRTLM